MSDREKGLNELAEHADQLETLTEESMFGDIRVLLERMKGDDE